MGVNTTALKSPNGLLKIIALVLAIIVCGLGRGAFIGFADGNVSWLYHGTIVGGIITLVIMIITYLLGDVLPLRTEALFVMIFSIMFIATGGCAIEAYQKVLLTTRDEGLAMGSMAIITGLVMFIDLLLLVKAIVKK